MSYFTNYNKGIVQILLTAFISLLSISVHAQLVGHWRLNGDATDASGNGLNGTLKYGAGFTSDHKEGSQSLLLSGSFQHIDLGNPSALPSGLSARSISVWAKNTATDSALNSAATFGINWSTNAMFIGRLGTKLQAGGFNDDLTVEGVWKPGVWRHICLTYDGTQANLYVDGILRTWANKSWSLIQSQAYIGKLFSDYENLWTGEIDEVRIYSKALTSTEVQALYNGIVLPPTALNATPASGSTVNLSWTDGSSDESAFQIERSVSDNSNYTSLASILTNVTAYSDTSAASGTQYYYRVRAACNSDLSSTIEQHTTTTGAAVTIPGTLSGTPNTPNSVNLTWGDITGETAFQIERWSTGGTHKFVTVPANTTSYTDTGLSEGTAYYYHVRAKTSSGRSPYSNTLSLTTGYSAPAAPTALVLTAEAFGAVDVSWTKNSTNETGFQIDRSENGGSYGTLMTTQPGIVSFQDTTVVPGTSYSYRVRAVNPTGNSSYVINTVTTPADNTLVGQWMLNGDANDASGHGITGTLVQGASFNTDSREGSKCLKLNGNLQHVTLGNPSILPSGQAARSMSIWAKTNTSDGALHSAMTYGINWPSNAMFIGQMGPDLVVGGFGDDITVSNVWSTTGAWHHICLTYNNGVAKVYVDGNFAKSASKSWSLIQSQAYIGRLFSDYDNLWNGELDDARIYSRALTQGEIYRMATDGPSMPTGFTATALSATSVRLNWTGDAKATGFQIERKQATDANYKLVTVTAAGANTYTDNDVTGGTTYNYHIRANGSKLNSDNTADVNATTLPGGLVSQWNFDDDATDAVGGNNGTIKNGATFSTDHQQGSKSLLLDGSSQYIDLSTSAGLPVGLPVGRSPRSISAWAKTNVGNTYRWIISYGKDNMSSAMFIGQNGAILLGGAYADDLIVQNQNVWTVGVWHHVCLTYDGTTAILYLDGVQVQSGQRNWDLQLAKAYIGRQVNDDEYWNGNIDDVRIYSKALTLAEVQALATPPPPHVPFTPSGLTVDTPTQNSLKLTWADNSSNETGFEIWRKKQGDANYALVQTINGTNPTTTASYTDTGLLSATSYHYQVRALSTLGASLYSNDAFNTTLSVNEGNVPDENELQALKDLQAAFQFNGYYNWNALSSMPSGTKNDVFGTLYGLTMTNGDITGLSLGYSDLGGTISPSIGNLTALTSLDISGSYQMSGGIPASIGNLSELTYFNAQGCNLSGAVPSEITQLPKLDNLVLSYNNLTSLPNFNLLANAPDNVYIEVYSNPLDFYSLEINVLNGLTGYNFVWQEPSLYYNVVSLTPQVGTLVIKNDFAKGATGFQWKQSSDGGNTWTDISVEAGGQNKDLTLTNVDGSYVGKQFVCTETCDNDWFSDLQLSSSTFVIDAVMPVEVPQNLTATARTSSKISISWTADPTTGTGYEIARAASATDSFNAIKTVNVSVTSYNDTDLTPTRTYYYKIRKVNGSSYSDYTPVVNATTLDTIYYEKIPQALKITRDGRKAAPPIERQFMLADINQTDVNNVFPAPPCLEGSYYVGFQMYYDLGDKLTTNNWLSRLEISLLHGSDTLWTKPLQLTMSNQTFVATVFHNEPISCDGQYQFVIARKTSSGTVPDENIYLKVLLHRQDAPPFDIHDNITVECNNSFLSWNHSRTATIAYDVEWVYINQYEIFTDPDPSKAFKFKEPARITIADNTMSEQLSKYLYFYDTGRVWHRVRAVGFNPQYPNHRVTGEWFYGCSAIPV